MILTLAEMCFTDDLAWRMLGKPSKLPHSYNKTARGVGTDRTRDGLVDTQLSIHELKEQDQSVVGRHASAHVLARMRRRAVDDDPTCSKVGFLWMAASS